MIDADIVDRARIVNTVLANLTRTVLGRSNCSAGSIELFDALGGAANTNMYSNTTCDGCHPVSATYSMIGEVCAVMHTYIYIRSQQQYYRTSG